MVEENTGVKMQNSSSKKGLEKNVHACSVEGVLWVSDFTSTVFQSVFKGGRARLGKFQASQSADSSESDKQKSLT